MARAFSVSVVTNMCKKEEFHKRISVPFLYSPGSQKLSYSAWSSSHMKEQGYSTQRGQAAAAELYCFYQSLRIRCEDALS